MTRSLLCLVNRHRPETEWQLVDACLEVQRCERCEKALRHLSLHSWRESQSGESCSVTSSCTTCGAEREEIRHDRTWYSGVEVPTPPGGYEGFERHVCQRVGFCARCGSVDSYWKHDFVRERCQVCSYIDPGDGEA